MKLPACLDIERLVLGYAILNAAELESARSCVDVEDFSTEAHRRIWKRVCEMFDCGKPVDRITVYQELLEHGEAESVGGLTYLVELDSHLPDNPRLDGYYTHLREANIRRRIMAEAQNLMNRAADETDNVSEILSSFATASTDLDKTTDASRRPISTADMIAVEGLDALLSPRRHGDLVLPWEKLDYELKGLGPGQMVVLMAATSRGKTSMATQIATRAAIQGFTPVIWTMEMSPRSLFQRIMTQLSQCHCGPRLTFEEREAVRIAIGQVQDHPIYFDRHSRNVGSFVASLRQVRSRGNGLGLAVVDYLQQIRGGARGAHRAQEVSDNSRSLKLAAMDLGIPFLVLSQVDRGSVKGEGSIGLHSAKESGDIENDADVVLWIDGTELSRDQPTTVSLHIGKQREGPAGFSIPMSFNPRFQTFTEIAQ